MSSVRSRLPGQIRRRLQTVFPRLRSQKSEPAEKQVPHSRMFRLKSEVQSPALGKNTAQIIEKAYADSFFLPLLRLRASTLRPLAVLMRLRKP